jgi:predicted nuclease of predicted toxin-antitoxin system
MPEMEAPIQFLADAGVHAGLVVWLKSLGYDAIAVREIGLGSASDQAIFAYASNDRPTIVTFDLDFSSIVRAATGRRTSMILLRLRRTRLLRVIERVRDVLPRCESALRQGAIVVVTDGHHRVRRLLPDS